MSIINNLFACFPSTEVFARNVYKSSSGMQKQLKSLKKIFTHPENSKFKNVTKDISALELKEILKNAGIFNGDILIAHTSVDGLGRVSASSIEILDMLINIVGQDGTLVLPSFPKYKKQSSDQLPKFDYTKFIAWTGIIPNLFIRERKAIVSHLPLNTLAAYGNYAYKMFEEESLAVTTYGRYTPWDFCRLHHAKVLFLGVEAFHSISEAHIVEDLLDEDYPIQDWHEIRTYLVGAKGTFAQQNYRIRKDIWSKYLVEHYHQKKLLKDKILRDIGEGRITAYIIDDLEKYVNYMMEHVKHGDLLDFKVPSKFWKPNLR